MDRTGLPFSRREGAIETSFLKLPQTQKRRAFQARRFPFRTQIESPLSRRRFAPASIYT